MTKFQKFDSVVRGLTFTICWLFVFIPTIGHIFAKEGDADWPFRLAVCLGLICAWGRAREAVLEHEEEKHK